MEEELIAKKEWKMLCRKLFAHGLPQGLLMAALAVVLLVGGLATQVGAQGASGATLQAEKTLGICLESDGKWTYSGAVSVWNTGTNDATGCKIFDKIESKVSGPTFTQQYIALDNVSCGILGTVSGGTTPPGFVTTYSVTNAPLSGTIRNNAQVTIDNHSGGRTNGPNPKATYTGSIPPPACPEEGGCGCSLTQGYWKNHPEDLAWDTADLSVFDTNGNGSGAEEALVILQTPPIGGSAWLRLAHQYIPYLLNKANGACTPPSLQLVVTTVGGFFSTYHSASDCPVTTGRGGSNNPCGAPVADVCILDIYNNGLYPDGPTHCGGTEDPGDPAGETCQQ